MSDTGVEGAAIWERHRDELIRYATVLVGASHAEDVVGTVIERVLRRPGGLGSLDDPRPYLFKAVLNQSRNHRRSRSNPSGWSDSVVLPEELRPEVLDAVLELPERQRAAVYLRYWRDLPISETAELMGCRPGTVKRYLHLARRRLQGVLEP